MVNKGEKNPLQRKTQKLKSMTEEGITRSGSVIILRLMGIPSFVYM
jgi:hypothetical protein